MINLGTLDGQSGGLGGVLHGGGLSADGVPWFTQEQPEFFRVEIPSRRKAPNIVRHSSHRPNSKGKVYDFSLHSGRSFVNGVVDAMDEEEEVIHGDLVGADERFRYLSDRATYRSKRVRCFSAGRQFPALVSERLLPSFKLVNDAKQASLGEAADSARPKLLTPTTSLAKKRTSKRRLRNHLPFVPSGSGGKRDRIPEVWEDSYDAPKEAARDEVLQNKNKWIDGAFKPSSAKLGTSLSQSSSSAGQSSQPGSRLSSARRLPRLRHGGGEAANDQPVQPDGLRCESNSRSNTGVEACPALAPPWVRNTSLAEAPEEEDCEPKEHLAHDVEEGDSDVSPVSPRRNFAEQHRQSQVFRSPSPKKKLLQSLGKAPTVPNIGKGQKGVDGDGIVDAAIPLTAKSATAGTLLHDSEQRIRAEVEKQAEERYCWNVFRRLSAGGKMQRTDIGVALQQLGVKRADEDWINQLYEDLGHDGRQESLSFEEFIQFREVYAARQLQMYKEAFEKCDVDRSGVVDVAELKDLLLSFDIEPMSHVLHEVISEVDADGTGELNFVEFQSVMDILRAREGFVKSEYTEYKDLFTRFAVSKAGHMDVCNVGTAMTWLGLKLPEDELDSIMKEIDSDKSGYIDEKEWLTFLRQTRDRIIDRVKDFMSTNDDDGDGTVSFTEVERCMRHLGYVPEPGTIHDCGVAAGLPVDSSIDLSGMWRLFMLLREREGLSSVDLRELDTCWNHQAAEGADAIDNSKVGKMIRSMGYTLSFEIQQELVTKVDIDDSGQVDKKEFSKLIRMIHERDLDMYRTAFREASNFRSGSKPAAESIRDKFSSRAQGPVISLAQARHALRRVGCVDAEGVVATIQEEDTVADNAIDFFGFCRVATRSRKQARDAFKHNGGFRQFESDEIRRNFERYDEDGSGAISGKEIARLLELEFPYLYNDMALRPQIKQLLIDADEDKNDCIDIMDFLRLMRLIKDLKEQLGIEKELQAVSECNFLPSEVEEFRQLFHTTSNGASEISFEPFRDLLACIVPMGAKHEEQLEAIFTEKAARQMGVDGAKELLDFPEFLWLMRELLDRNWANIAERTSAVVENGEQTRRIEGEL